jgi:hypothetical protein
VTGAVVIAAAAYRYWIAKKRRPTFATSLPGTTPVAAKAPADQTVIATPLPPAINPEELLS